MSKEMYISSSPHETKVAVLEDDQLVEVYFERDTDVGLVGGIYKGRVSRVLPGMQSAFVDIGLERDAFLYVSDFYEDQEEYDKVFEEAENRATKFTNQTAGTAAPIETAAASVVAAEAAAPVAAPVAEAAPVPEAAAVAAPPAEPPAAAAPSPTPVFTPHPTRESNDRRGFDPRRGRRRRHRGRPEFGDNRPSDRPDRRFTSPPAPSPSTAPVDEAPAEAHPFEILPGESLAKYRHPNSESDESAGNVMDSPQITGTAPHSPELEAGVSDNLSENSAASEGHVDAAEAASLSEAVPAPAEVSAATAEPAVAPAEVAAADIAPASTDEMPARKAVVEADEPVPFTPSAMYGSGHSVGVEHGSPVPDAAQESAVQHQAPVGVSTPPAKTQDISEISSATISSNSEANPAKEPEEIAIAASGIIEAEEAGFPAQSAETESPSERAELEVSEERRR